MRQETQSHLLFATVLLGFLSIFKRSQAWSPFEALNSACLSRCQRVVRPPVKVRPGTRAYSRVSTGDSDIPSSCEMKGEPSFKPLQGNPSLFRVRASRCPLHLKQIFRVPHIRIAEGSLLFRCLWKVGIPLQLKPWNQLSSQNDLGCTHLYSSFCAGIGVPPDLCPVSQGISGVA